MLSLLRDTPAARRFFAALTQSAAGTGIGYVALLVVAYDRLRSPWAISLLLLADFLPAMLLGPLLGAACDRWSRRTCLVVADLVRAVAFVGLGLVGDFALMLPLALLAGAGTGLFAPAAYATLPALVGRERAPAATGLFATVNSLGLLVGPAAAAPLLLLAGAPALLVVNGLSFALSAAILCGLPRDTESRQAPAASDAEPRSSLLRDARRAVRAVLGIPGLATMIAASGASALFAAMINVGEPLLVREAFGLGASSVGLLVAVSGLGQVVGSLAAARAATVPQSKRRWLAALATAAAGVLLTGLAPAFVSALVGVLLAGLGLGMLLVHERALTQAVVPDEVMGSAFGLIDSVLSWAMGSAFIAGGALAALLGARALFVVAGVGMGVVCLAAVVALRGVWTEAQAPRVAAPALAPA